MRRIFEWIGGFALIAFSFYFTDKVSLLVANKSELMQEIISVSSVYETEAVDAVINVEDNTIIPGKFGRKVNSKESYLWMHDFGSFNENYLVFDYIKPETSLEDNKDKYISSGNPSNRFVSLIVNSNEEVEKYLTSANIMYNTVALTYEEKSENVELINAAQTKEEFNTFTSKIDAESRLCLRASSNLELCEKAGYYLIDPKIELTNSNVANVENAISPGSIILISSQAKLENVKLILNEIEYKDLNIVHISKLISEKESA